MPLTATQVPIALYTIFENFGVQIDFLLMKEKRSHSMELNELEETVYRGGERMRPVTYVLHLGMHE